MFWLCMMQRLWRSTNLQTCKSLPEDSGSVIFHWKLVQKSAFWLLNVTVAHQRANDWHRDAMHIAFNLPTSIGLWTTFAPCVRPVSHPSEARPGASHVPKRCVLLTDIQIHAERDEQILTANFISHSWSNCNRIAASLACSKTVYIFDFLSSAISKMSLVPIRNRRSAFAFLVKRLTGGHNFAVTVDRSRLIIRNQYDANESLLNLFKFSGTAGR